MPAAQDPEPNIVRRHRDDDLRGDDHEAGQDERFDVDEMTVDEAHVHGVGNFRLAQ